MDVPEGEEAQDGCPFIVAIVPNVHSTYESFFDNIKNDSLVFGCYSIQHILFDVFFVQVHV